MSAAWIDPDHTSTCIRCDDDSDDVLGGPSLAEFADAGAAAAWLLGGALAALIASGFLALWGRDLFARLGGA